MKIASVLIPATFVVVLAFGLALTPPGADYYGDGYYHHHGYGYTHSHWNRYFNQDYRQWHQYGGNRGGW
jgi:hypothetical protein